MDIETATNDEIEQQLLRSEAVIARERALQMTLLREVDRRQLPTASGCGSLGEWVQGRLDVAPETARDLIATAKHLEGLPHVEEAVETGVIGFASLESRISSPVSHASNLAYSPCPAVPHSRRVAQFLQ